MKDKDSVYLFSWISQKDVAYTRGEEESSQFSAFMEDGTDQKDRALDYDRVLLLHDARMSMVGFDDWYAGKQRTAGWPPYTLFPRQIDNHQSYKKIYKVTENLVADYPHVQRHYLISGGSKAMGLVWFLVHAKSYADGKLLSASQRFDKTDQVEELKFPFALNVTYLSNFMTTQTLDEIELNKEAFKKLLPSSRDRAETLKKAQLGATAQLPIHIRGETGSGKEEMAKALAHIARPHTKMVAVNCSAIPADLIESQLFGHKKGAFTGAERDHDGHFIEADKGTLFLDEVGELSLAAQARLLRVIQEKQVRRVGDDKDVSVDVYIISATHKDLISMVQTGAFREDLYYRLVVWPLSLQPIRDWSPRDFENLVRWLWQDICQEVGEKLGHANPHKPIPHDVVRSIIKQPWPGNVRQLQNALKRLFVLSGKGPVKANLLDESMSDSTSTSPLPSERFDLEERLNLIKDGWLVAAQRQEGTWEKAAAYLGMPPSTLNSYRKKRAL